MKVIFQDDFVLVLDKSAGIVVDKSDTQKQETLEDILQKDYKIKLKRAGIVHRLDKDTSGVILIAKTQTALENLQAQFKERKTKKEYLALVHGFVRDGGVVEGDIGRNPLRREKFTVLLGGKEAVTKYESLQRLQFTSDSLLEIFQDFNKIQMRKLSTIQYNLYTLLKCHPLTGRTHQIRVHLKYIGHPIVSDQTYVGRKMYRLDKRWCPRQFLHAAKIGFEHPVIGKWMEFASALPEDLEDALSKLKSQMSKL